MMQHDSEREKRDDDDGPTRNPVRRLEELAAELRSDAAIEGRRREHMVRARMESEATLLGALAGSVGLVCEIGADGSRRFAGDVVAVDSAVVELASAGRSVWLNAARIRWVRPARRVPAAAPVDRGSWAGFLEDVWAGDLEMTLSTVDDTTLHGRLLSVGEVVAVEDLRGGVTYLDSDALVALSRRS